VETLDASWYRDPSVYERERSAIFATSWQYVGHRHQFKNTGDYVALDIAGWPIFVAVDDHRVLKGFHNVCAHRAGPIVAETEGICTLTCRYHGWTYRWDGELLTARDFQGDEATLAGARLSPVHVATWRNLVFASLAAQPEPLEVALGSLPHLAASYRLEDYEPRQRATHAIAANWKTYADNYGEGYHIPMVHPALNRAVDVRSYRVELLDDGRLHRHISPPRDGAPTTGEWLYLWPNMAFNLYPNGMSVERFMPRSVDRVDVMLDYFFLAGTSDVEVKASLDSSEEITAEDVAICEAVQRNLNAGRYQSGVLSPRHENGVAALQRLVREALARETLP
jgi:choline monooxygenase